MEDTRGEGGRGVREEIGGDKGKEAGLEGTEGNEERGELERKKRASGGVSMLRLASSKNRN